MSLQRRLGRAALSTLTLLLLLATLKVRVEPSETVNVHHGEFETITDDNGFTTGKDVLTSTSKKLNGSSGNIPFSGGLDRRAVTKETWNSFVHKGQSLLVLMCADAEAATQMMRSTAKPGTNVNSISSQSQWTDYTRLKYFGWRPDDATFMVDFSDTGTVPIKQSMDALGLSTGITPNGPNIGSYWEHEEDSPPGVGTYPATKANYLQAFNPKQGAIMAWGNYGSAFMMAQAYKDKPQPPLVPLRQWSDVVFLEWQHLCDDLNEGSIKGLHYVYQLLISNPDSKALIQMAMDKMGKALDYWPGTKFSRSSEGFKALLGSPNGSGVAWLLINHKRQLGQKMISKITVFRHDGAADSADPTMLFWMIDPPFGGAAPTED